MLKKQLYLKYLPLIFIFSLQYCGVEKYTSVKQGSGNGVQATQNNHPITVYSLNAGLLPVHLGTNGTSHILPWPHIELVPYCEERCYFQLTNFQFQAGLENWAELSKNSTEPGPTVVIGVQELWQQRHRLAYAQFFKEHGFYHTPINGPVQRSGLMIFSSRPMDNFSFTPYKKDSFPFFRKGVLNAQIEIPGFGKLNLSNTHTAYSESKGHQSKHNRIHRIQYAQILRILGEIDGPIILTGDLNGGPELQLIQRQKIKNGTPKVFDFGKEVWQKFEENLQGLGLQVAHSEGELTTWDPHNILVSHPALWVKWFNGPWEESRATIDHIISSSKYFQQFKDLEVLFQNTYSYSTTKGIYERKRIPSSDHYAVKAIFMPIKR